MDPQPQTFTLKQETPRRGLMYLINISFLLLVFIPAMGLSIKFGGGMLSFLTFLCIGVLYALQFKYWFHAPVIVHSDRLGLTLEVTHSRLGLPKGRSFYTWEQLKGFKQSLLPRQGHTPSDWFKKSHYLTLYWADGRKTCLLSGDEIALRQHLLEVCPEKKRKHWFWPEQN